jgi:hypothetical protein
LTSGKKKTLRGKLAEDHLLLTGPVARRDRDLQATPASTSATDPWCNSTTAPACALRESRMRTIAVLLTLLALAACAPFQGVPGDVCNDPTQNYTEQFDYECD